MDTQTHEALSEQRNGPSKEHAMITTVGDLREWVGADTVQGINHRLYKDTDCGASISIRVGGVWYHNGDGWSSLRDGDTLELVSLQSIVEGSDATAWSGDIPCPAEDATLSQALDDVEWEAETLWEEAQLWEDEDA